MGFEYQWCGYLIGPYSRRWGLFTLTIAHSAGFWSTSTSSVGRFTQPCVRFAQQQQVLLKFCEKNTGISFTLVGARMLWPMSRVLTAILAFLRFSCQLFVYHRETNLDDCHPLHVYIFYTFKYCINLVFSFSCNILIITIHIYITCLLQKHFLQVLECLIFVKESGYFVILCIISE